MNIIRWNGGSVFSAQDITSWGRDDDKCQQVVKREFFGRIAAMIFVPAAMLVQKKGPWKALKAASYGFVNPIFQRQMLIDEKMICNISKALRDHTQKEHGKINKDPFVVAYIGSEEKLSDAQKNYVKGKYYEYLTYLKPILSALEEIQETLKDHPVIKHVYFPEVFRLEALNKDLAAMNKEDAPKESFAYEYAEYLFALAKKSPYLVVAHAYINYLRDLSGGQMIKGKLADKGWTNYLYQFEGSNVAKLREDYRSALDTLPLTREEAQELVAETNRAYVMNQMIIDDLKFETPS